MERRAGAKALERARPAAPEAAKADEFSATEVLTEGFRTWLSQLPAYAGITLLLHAPLLLVSFLPLPHIVVVPVFLAVEVAIAIVIKAALTKAVLDYQRTLETDFSELIEALRGAPSVLILGARILGRALIKTFYLVAPGIKYLCEMFAAIPAYIAEGGSMERAQQRSARLTDGVRIQVFSICLVIWAVAAFWTFAFGVLDGGGMGSKAWILFYLSARSLDRSWAAVLSAVNYHFLCARPDPAPAARAAPR